MTSRPGVIPRLHLVTDDEVLAGPDFVGSATAALAAGGSRVGFHLRGHRTSARRLWEIGSALRPVASAEGATFLVNDRLDIALALGAEGGHLAGHSVTVSDARALLGPTAVVGCSVHGSGDAGRARDGARDGTHDGAHAPAGAPAADFVIAGTLFETPTHPRNDARGVGLIAEVQRALPGMPVVGIGGIDGGRIPETIAAGAYGVAVVRAVWAAPDAGAAVEELLAALEHAGASS